MTTASRIDLGLARQLADCALGSRSGIVTAVRGKLKRLFCLNDGQLAFAVSNVIEEQLSEHLLRENLVPLGDLVSAQRAADGAGTGLTATLLKRGSLKREALESALETHVRNLLFATLDWSDGESTLARGRPDIGGEIEIRLPCASLLFEYARSHPATLPEVQARIGPGSLRLTLGAERLELLAQLELAPAVSRMLDGCDGDTSVGELVATTPGDEDANWRALYALLLLGVVAPLEVPVSAADGLTREEVRLQLDRLENADHYALLGLGPTATSDKIREAYYALARRFHPDRFRSGPLEDLLLSVERYFGAVTEAYNTLYNPHLRAAYDEQIAAGRETQPEQDSAFLAKENYRRGKALVLRGRFTDALTSLDNAVKLDPLNATYRVELGQLMARNPRLRQQAEKHLIEANRIDPSLVEGYLALGDLYAKSNRRDDAVGLYREVLRWEPGHLEATERLRRLGVR